MSGIGTSQRRSSARLPNLEALTNFFGQLRASQYRLDPRQLAAAHRILLSAHAENWGVEHLRFVLMILLAKTRQEQSDFDARFDLWLGISKESSPTGLATRLARRTYAAGLITLLVTVAVAGLLAVRAWYIGPPPTTIPSGDILPQPNLTVITRALEAVSSLGLADALRAAAVVPLVLLAAFVLLRLRRRTLWVAARAEGKTIELDQLEIAPALGPIFGGPALPEIARELRRHRPVPMLELDIERTVEATARQAGHFTAVWRQQVRRPEYVVLIEENSYRDHIARILDAGIDALKKLEVSIQRFYYNSDLRVVVADDHQRTPFGLAVLAECGRHARLIIFGSGRGLVHPLTDRLGTHLRQPLQRWIERIFLSTEAVGAWGVREHQLLRDGFSLGTASMTGLVAVAARVAQGSPQGGTLLEPRLKISYGLPAPTALEQPTGPPIRSTQPELEISLTPSWRESLAVYLQRRVLIVMFLGFSSGLPFALSGSTLLVWMREAGVDLGTIGLFALVGTPYTFKFLWAPLVDALHVPLFTRRFGRRRGWLLFSQVLLIVTILLLAIADPARSPPFVAFAALLVATASSTQDIVVDAFRIESLPESEQAAGMASYVAAYRIGMLVSTAGALFIVSGFEATGLARTAAWMWGYAVMAALVLIGTVTALLATEPEQSERADAAVRTAAAFTRVLYAALGAFTEFFSRKDAITALAFVVLFKFTDAFSGTMTAPFVIDIGFSRNNYAAIVKGVGLAATLIGGFAGGFVARRYSLAASLLIGGSLQAVANLSFSWLALVGPNESALALAITAENFTSAIGTVIFVAYLSALCQNPLNTATQYALLTALAAVGRTYLSSGAGYVAKAAGWPLFFVICVLVAMPSLVLLAWLQRRGHFEPFEPYAVRGAPKLSGTPPV